MPAWLVAGADVVHPSYGTGVVHGVGEEHHRPVVWVDFDYGERKELGLDFAVDLLRRPQAGSPRTRPRGDVRCDECGARPVVERQEGHQRCETHAALGGASA